MAKTGNTLILVDRIKTGELLQEAVPGARTVPQIFIDEKYIGGYQELQKHLE